jgi:hypothetical protein
MLPGRGRLFVGPRDHLWILISREQNRAISLGNLPCINQGRQVETDDIHL